MTTKDAALPFVLDYVFEVGCPMCFLYEDNIVFVVFEISEGSLATIRRTQAECVNTSDTTHDGGQNDVIEDKTSHDECLLGGVMMVEWMVEASLFLCGLGCMRFPGR